MLHLKENNKTVHFIQNKVFMLENYLLQSENIHYCSPFDVKKFSGPENDSTISVLQREENAFSSKSTGSQTGPELC